MTYANCTAAYKAGVSDIPKSSPDYAKKLDRDNDGIGCESGDAPAWFAKAGGKTTTGTSTGTETETGNGQGTALPKTGPAAEVGGVGAALLVFGLAAVIVRRRKIRFQA